MSRRILLVEDSLADARLVQRRVQGFGGRGPPWQLEHVSALAPALMRLREHPYDVVLLDLGLPDSFGLETLEAVRELDPDLPVVVITGSQDEELGLKALESGAQEHLVKSEIGSARELQRALLHAIERNALREHAGHFANAQNESLWTVAAGAGRAYDRLLARIVEDLDVFAQSRVGASATLRRHVARIRRTVLEGERLGERLRAYASSQEAGSEEDDAVEARREVSH